MVTEHEELLVLQNNENKDMQNDIGLYLCFFKLLELPNANEVILNSAGTYFSSKLSCPCTLFCTSRKFY